MTRSHSSCTQCRCLIVRCLNLMDGSTPDIGILSYYQPNYGFACFQSCFMNYHSLPSLNAATSLLFPFPSSITIIQYSWLPNTTHPSYPCNFSPSNPPNPYHPSYYPNSLPSHPLLHVHAWVKGKHRRLQTVHRGGGSDTARTPRWTIIYAAAAYPFAASIGSSHVPSVCRWPSKSMEL
ncbi:unnamed protein product [Closterium sp. NIES-54]